MEKLEYDRLPARPPALSGTNDGRSLNNWQRVNVYTYADGKGGTNSTAAIGYVAQDQHQKWHAFTKDGTPYPRGCSGLRGLPTRGSAARGLREGARVNFESKPAGRFEPAARASQGAPEAVPVVPLNPEERRILLEFLTFERDGPNTEEAIKLDGEKIGRIVAYRPGQWKIDHGRDDWRGYYNTRHDAAIAAFELAPDGRGRLARFLEAKAIAETVEALAGLHTCAVQAMATMPDTPGRRFTGRAADSLKEAIAQFIAAGVYAKTGSVFAAVEALMSCD